MDPSGVSANTTRASLPILTVVAVALVGLGAYALYAMGPGGRAALWTGVGRTIAWVIIAGVLPWSAKAFIGRILAAGTNWAGLALIAAYTTIDLIAGRLLMGAWPASGWGWLAALAALGIAGSYNYLVTEYLAQAPSAIICCA